jgi:hypothetical protein
MPVMCWFFDSLEFLRVRDNQLQKIQLNLLGGFP